ncbi:MAG: triose-phosphate isomerase [bacterium]|nr:triose-phosphate isomerase [bacterium]
MAKKIIIGNWKMNPVDVKEAEVIAGKIVAGSDSLKKISIVVCPPFQYLERVGPIAKKKVVLGAQDCFFGGKGPYTGEVSPEMIKSMGVKYVIIGHSERRALGESDELINKKVGGALSVGLKVILCVGERSRDDSGEFLNFIKSQISQGLDKIKKSRLKNLLVAYEPIWAIGKDALHPATVQDVLEISIFIKKVLVDLFGREEGLKVPIVYGGSVDVNNCREFLTDGQADGLLVGRESLNPENFIKILKTANEL